MKKLNPTIFPQNHYKIETHSETFGVQSSAHKIKKIKIDFDSPSNFIQSETKMSVSVEDFKDLFVFPTLTYHHDTDMPKSLHRHILLMFSPRKARIFSRSFKQLYDLDFEDFEVEKVFCDLFIRNRVVCIILDSKGSHYF